MGLFGGLVKDSPATFAINSIRAQRGRMAKAKSKRKGRLAMVEHEFEPRHLTARRMSRYALVGAVLMPLGSQYVGAVALLGLAFGFMALEKFFTKRLDNLKGEGIVKE